MASSMVFEPTTPTYRFEALVPSCEGTFEEEMAVLDALFFMSQRRSGREVKQSGLLRNILDQVDRVLAVA
jgi:hypothetical protein